MLIVLKHEFRQKIRSKAFIIFTFIAPLLMGAAIAVPILITVMNEGNDKQLTIIDSTGRLGKYFAIDTAKRSLLQDPRSGSAPSSSLAPKMHITVIDPSLTSANTVDSLKALLLQKKISGYLLIPPGAINDSGVTAILRMTNANDFTAQEYLSSHYKDGLFTERLRTSGIDPDFVKKAHNGTEIETLKVTEEKETNDNGVGFIGGYITGMFLYISMLLYGSLIMQSVIEEKNSRVIELLSSSVRPIEILIGKVLGVGLAGLVQISAWAVMFA